MFLSGLLLAVAVWLLLIKLPRVHRASLNNPAASDVIITLGVILLGLFTLTFSGLIMGVIAGIMLSVYFSVAPKVRDIARQHPLKRQERIINPQPLNLEGDLHAQFEQYMNEPRALPAPPKPKLDAIDKFLAKQEKRKPMTYDEAMKIIKGE